MRTLALDIGNKKTGVAFLDEATGIPLPLDTLHHASDSELLSQIATIMKDRSVDRIVVGLPFLPSGQEGEQAGIVRAIIAKLIAMGFDVFPIDERYSTDRPSGSDYDKDAAAACVLLSLYASRNLNSPG